MNEAAPLKAESLIGLRCRSSSAVGRVAWVLVGASVTQVAGALRVWPQSVHTWIGRYLAEGRGRG
jgi:hypothetical protein